MPVTATEISSAAVAVAVISAGIAWVSYKSARRSETLASRSAAAAERSATASESQAAIEDARERRDTRPQFSARVRFIGGPNRELTLTLESGEILTSLEVRLPDPKHGPCFNKGSRGVHDPEDGSPVTFRAYAYDAQTGQPAGLRPLQTLTWPLVMPPGRRHRETLRIEADCHAANGRHWPAVLIEARAEPDMMRTIG